MVCASLLVVLLSGDSGQGAVRPSEAALAEKSRAGKELMAAGRYAEAATAYRELVKAVPGNAGLLVNLGMALHLSGKDQEAIPPLEAALRLDPASLPANLFLGGARLRVGRAEAAIAPLQNAVRLQPDSLEARSMLAEALMGLQRPAQAEPHLRRITQLAPADPAAWFNLGQAYEELAGQSFHDLLERDPESPLTLALVGEVRLDERRRREAFQLYRQAAERAPTMRGLHAALARIYKETDHADWAAIEEERERRLGAPDCAREALACAFAAGRYREVVAAAPGPPTLDRTYWRARAYGELAGQAFARLTSLPPSVHSYEWQAATSRTQRSFAESVDLWRKALALAPGDPRLLTELAVTLRMNRDLAEAQRVLEEAMRADADAPETSFLLGDVLLAREQPARAIPFLEKAVRADPREPRGHAALGRAYALVGRPADAITHLKQSLESDVDGSLRLQLGRAYQATGQTELAQAALKDYEEFRKAQGAGSETGGKGAIAPPR
ncbi:MAG TPA: tetratricopeptide repeat protein [Vicinamibacteria bacterium]